MNHYAENHYAEKHYDLPRSNFFPDQYSFFFLPKKINERKFRVLHIAVNYPCDNIR